MADGPIDAAKIESVLADFKDPETGRSALKMDQIKDIETSDQRISLTLELTTYAAPIWERARQSLESLLKASFPDQEIHIQLATHDRPPQKLGQLGIPVKSVIAVGSGKGGVGKSTVAASIAFGLQRAGCRVGLLDADVYGPSIPHLLGLPFERPQVTEEKKIMPKMSGEMPVMSMGFLVPPGEPVIWRGPMLHGAITQMLRDTLWGNLDYLIIDMPPGTGDIALTLSQALPLTGAVVVCTPQDVALLDAEKAIGMFNKVNIPVLGMVENMSGFQCPDCNKRYDIFGSGGAKERAQQLKIPFLGEVPIQMQIRVNGDEGQTAQNYDDEAVRPYFESICQALVQHIADKNSVAPPVAQLPVL